MIHRPQKIEYYHKMIDAPSFLNIMFEFNIEDIADKNVEFCLPDSFLVENIVDLNKTTFGHHISGQSFLVDELMKMVRPLLPSFSNNLHYEANKYICKKIGKEIKYKNNYIEIPLLSFSNDQIDESSKYNFYSIHIRLVLDDESNNYAYDFLKKYFNENIFLKLKNNDDDEYYITSPSRWVKLDYDCIKYVYIIYYSQCYGTKRIDNVIDVRSYEDKFLDLIKNYKNIVLKIKDISCGAIILFTIDDDSEVEEEFIGNLNRMIGRTYTCHDKKKYSHHFGGLYVVIKNEFI